MNRLLISEVDPFDGAELAAAHAVFDAGIRDGVGEAAVVWTLPELEVDVREPNRRTWRAMYAARTEAGGPVVAVGRVFVPLLDNLSNAEVEVVVPTTLRRRGHGSAMLTHLEAVVGERGRTVLAGESSWLYDLGPEPAGWPGYEFALHHGYRLALGDVQRHLDLPLDDDLLARLAAEAASHHDDYTLRTWVGPVPDDIVVSWLTLSSTLMTEAPTGEKQVEPETVDVDALREGEDRIDKQGRVRYHAVALDAAGDVVAYTDIVSTVHEPGRCYQWGTLVRADHRGHRLGMAVKVANHQQIQRERPDLREVITWNAEVNAHMIGVNEQLGYRKVARLGEFEKKVGDPT